MKQENFRYSFRIAKYSNICLPIIFGLMMLFSCKTKIPESTAVDVEPKITPDYSEITIPPNIAPLNFSILESADEFLVRFSSQNYSFITESGEGEVIIPLDKWKKLLENAKGEDILIDSYARKGDKWTKYKTITNHVSEDSIDSHLVYRILSPGFELWHKMGIYQRNLENFEEKTVFNNDLSDNSCMNCHTFCRNNSSNMMFHLRGKLSGTVVHRDGKSTLFNTKTDQTISPAVYPAWHPGGRFIAYSVNQIVQAFHAIPQKRVEVLDTLSDIVVLDLEKRALIKSQKLSTSENFETFPAWSPDGISLYYCSAQAKKFDDFNKIRYNLMKVSFDPESLRFGAADTVISSSVTGQSVSFPRISPDGKYLMFCLTDYGNFSIWHRESDLYLLNIVSGEITKPGINSGYSESYHQWSSDGRWIVFSSRRRDGLFTRLYFSYFDENGNAHKPFVLPQKDPGFYDSFMKSYNIPELITSEIKISPYDISGIARTTPVNVEVVNVQ